MLLLCFLCVLSSLQSAVPNGYFFSYEEVDLNALFSIKDEDFLPPIKKLHFSNDEDDTQYDFPKSQEPFNHCTYLCSNTNTTLPKNTQQATSDSHTDESRRCFVSELFKRLEAVSLTKELPRVIQIYLGEDAPKQGVEEEILLQKDMDYS